MMQVRSNTERTSHAVSTSQSPASDRDPQLGTATGALANDPPSRTLVAALPSVAPPSEVSRLSTQLAWLWSRLRSAGGAGRTTTKNWDVGCCWSESLTAEPARRLHANRQCQKCCVHKKLGGGGLLLQDEPNCLVREVIARVLTAARRDDWQAAC